MSSIDFFLCDKFLIQLKGLRSHIQPKSKSNKNIFFLSFICSFSYVGVFFLFALYTSICIYLPAVSVEWKKEEIQNIFFFCCGLFFCYAIWWWVCIHNTEKTVASMFFYYCRILRFVIGYIIITSSYSSSF